MEKGRKALTHLYQGQMRLLDAPGDGKCYPAGEVNTELSMEMGLVIELSYGHG